MAKVPPLEQTYYLAAPPERVFEALTNPKVLTRWFVDEARFTARKGGTFRFGWAGYRLRGKVKLIEPPKRLHLDWIDRFESGKTFETEARFSLKRKGKGTLLTINHRGFKSGKQWIVLYGGIQSGWAYYLSNLKSVLDHDVDLRNRNDVLG